MNYTVKAEKLEITFQVDGGFVEALLGAVPRGEMRGRVLLVVLVVDRRCGTRLEQQPHDGNAVVRARYAQTRRALGYGRLVRIRPAPQEALYAALLPLSAGAVERSLAVVVES